MADKYRSIARSLQQYTDMKYQAALNWIRKFEGEILDLVNNKKLPLKHACLLIASEKLESFKPILWTEIIQNCDEMKMLEDGRLLALHEKENKIVFWQKIKGGYIQSHTVFADDESKEKGCTQG